MGKGMLGWTRQLLFQLGGGGSSLPWGVVQACLGWWFKPVLGGGSSLPCFEAEQYACCKSGSRLITMLCCMCYCGPMSKGQYKCKFSCFVPYRVEVLSVC